ncbi:hypothetical protein F183_A01480 [Bryobacterales bacterium F-183]|nr:hypothetical protein F183_A01480 [Bryobacterales bacterium F-183]
MGNLQNEDSPESKTAAPPTDQSESMEIPEGVPPETRGSKQFALFAFIAIFVAILGSAVLYLASRRSTSAPPAQATVQPAVQPAVQAAAPAPVETPKPQPPPQPVPEPTTPATAPPVQPVEPPKPAAVEAPLTIEPGRWYLQVGSLEKRVADIMSQGLRIKGIPAFVSPGVTPLVSRIVAGPFDDPAQLQATEKQLKEMGFQPFARKFEASDLVEPPAQTAATPSPDVRR